MNIPLFDQTRKDEHNTYGEFGRLANQLRPKAAITGIGSDGLRFDYPAKWGFDCETAPYSDFETWMNSELRKESKVLFWFVLRVMAWRFPDKHTEIKSKLNIKDNLEFDMILSEIRHEENWLGEVSYQNMTTYSKIYNYLAKSKLIKLKNDAWKVIRA